ncbi:interleukin-1 receptor-associated kinase 1-binding protein 1 [Pelobates fuscus]|uniref:interleukin-1 receptor-associated kinase 1-binding protein 1 n=1 Tax=Pelobates fuscus TaxID=191477 RepID=UPI002FE44FF4
MASQTPAARLFASLPLSETADNLENKAGIVLGQRGGREVHVSGYSELSVAPDRARVSFHLSSTKAAAAEAKSSVQRRLEYIEQCLRQSGVSEENVNITKEFRKISNTYQMETEVFAIFLNFEKLQSVCNTLVEKLENSIAISPVQFYHSPQSLEKLRREVCIGAVGNARRKAQEICHLVGHSLGKALTIREEEMREWEDQSENYHGSLSIQHKIKSATIHASSKVCATFEIKTKERNKKNC